MNSYVIVTLLLFYTTIILGQCPNNIIQTTYGPVCGKILQTVDLKKQYYAYQGIPYAKPPVDHLRFRSSVPPNKWDEVLNATEEKPKCLQLLLDGSEDCLYLSVYVPMERFSSKSLPVMVWFYGGYFIYGEASYSIFGPDYFIEESVLVVMFNYRVGVFGFLSTEDEASPGNYGLKDQILALKWIKENIKYFGGDPNSITLFGESAGSACISYLIQSPLANNLFHKVIMESGTTLNRFTYAQNPRKVAFLTGRLLGIYTDDSTVLIEKLRKFDVNILQLISLITNIMDSVINNFLYGMSFAPTIELQTEDAVVTNKSYDILKHGNFNRVPMIVGFNSQESIPFIEFLDWIKLYVLFYQIYPADMVPIDMNIPKEDLLTKQLIGLQIQHHYFGSEIFIFDDKKLEQFVTDDQFVRGITEAVRLMSKYTDVYFYRFSYDSDYGLTTGETENRYGVGHEEELNFLFHHSESQRIPNTLDTIIRKRLIRLWTNFAKTGNPTPSKDILLQNSTWIKANNNNVTYFDIGNNLSMQQDLKNYSIDWWNDLYKRYGRPPYTTY